MRLIGKIVDKTHAERFASYLLTRSVETHCEQSGDHWELWIRDEDKIEAAKKELELFRNNPNGAVYRDAVEAAELIVRQKSKHEKQVRKQQVQMTGGRWNAPVHRVAPLTVTLVVITFVVALMTNFGYDYDGFAMRALALSSLTQAQLTEEYQHAEVRENGDYSVRLRMYSLMHFEIWRAVTPIFIHFGGWHFIFNMFWLVFLGRQIEMQYGPWWLMILVVLVAVPSNIAGALMPERLEGIAMSFTNTCAVLLAGGMSGVVYGLFGYVLIKMLFDDRSGLFISTGNCILMIVWLFACMTDAFQNALGMNVNNWAHGIGLLVGLAIGYLPKLLNDIGFRR